MKPSVTYFFTQNAENLAFCKKHIVYAKNDQQAVIESINKAQRIVLFSGLYSKISVYKETFEYNNERHVLLTDKIGDFDVWSCFD